MMNEGYPGHMVSSECILSGVWAEVGNGYGG